MLLRVITKDLPCFLPNGEEEDITVPFSIFIK
jgi:hypothetical protein